jgi:hypothetical protein
VWGRLCRLWDFGELDRLLFSFQTCGILI